MFHRANAMMCERRAGEVGPSPLMAAGLDRDTRGAILVPAIVMGALLTGALFYVAAAGDAIIYRTQLQDAADTTAFTSAVWHAKGMNIVAVINIFMSLLLLVIVLFHVVELICLLVALFPPATGLAMGVFRSLVQTEEKVAKGISSGLDVLHVTQQAVVVAVPYIAAFNAKRTPTAADTIWPGSLALLPTKIDTSILRQEKSRMPELGPAALPVQEDAFGTLCARSVMVIPEQIIGAVDRVAGNAPFGLGGIIKDKLLGLWDKVREQVDKVTEGGDGILCQPVNHIVAALADKAAGVVDDKVLDDACGSEANDTEKKAQAAKQQEAAANSPDGKAPPPKEPTAQERKETDKRKKKHADGCASDIVGDLAKSSEIHAVPAMVWSAAANGNVFMHTWSKASGHPRMFNHDQQFVAVASHGQQPAVNPSTDAVAEAEYYCDCEGKWSECQEDAMWAPNWTARMRRFRWPTEELAKMGQETIFNFGSVLQDVAFDQAQDVLSSLLGKKSDFAGDVIASFIVDNLRKIPLVETLTEKANAAIAQGIDAAGLTDLLELRHTDEKRIH